MGAALYTNKRGRTVEMIWAGEPGWLTPGNIRALFSYPLEQLDCLCVLGTIRCSNEKSRALAERMGCSRVGPIPHAFGEEDHGVLYCMRREKCPWLERKPSFLPAGGIVRTDHVNGGLHG
jgi:hypothetical protein